MLRDDDLAALTLLRTQGLSDGLYRHLLTNFGTAAEALRVGVAGWRASGVATKALGRLGEPDQEALRKDLDWLAQGDNHHLLSLGHADYPPRLAAIADPPPVLFVLGDPQLLNSPAVAMVGSRNPTPNGREDAQAFASYLARCGLVVISGLAEGVDGAAHEGALQANGPTVAVCGTGLDRVYPARHRELAHRIARTGALISEFPLGTPPLARNFPRRNRIVSGLALGVLVVEAALRSGSLITARQAMEQGREVFAIPGSIHNPLARGCHALIRQGAKLVETGADILEELASQLDFDIHPSPAPAQFTESFDDLDEKTRHVLAVMGYESVTVDTLVERSGLTAEAVSSMLLVMEIQGVVASAPGGLYYRQTKRL